MTVSPVERPIASASYGFVRFIGGGLAPYFAGRLAERFNIHVAFYVGAAAVALGIVILASGGGHFDHAAETLDELEDEALAEELGSAS